MGNYSYIIRIFSCASLVIAAVECFAGFKGMKAMLVVWGVFAGALLGTLCGSWAGSPVLGGVLVVLLSIMLVLLSFRFRLAGIFVLTTFLTTTALHMIFLEIWSSLILAVGVGLLAICFVKPVAIISSAISGAGTMLCSVYIMMKWTFDEAPVLKFVLWIPIALVGIAVQYITTQRFNEDKIGVRSLIGAADPSSTHNGRKSPAMQRAYRNFCIRCGCKLSGTNSKCPKCGYSCD